MKHKCYGFFIALVLMALVSGIASAMIIESYSLFGYDYVNGSADFTQDTYHQRNFTVTNANAFYFWITEIDSTADVQMIWNYNGIWEYTSTREWPGGTFMSIGPIYMPNGAESMNIGVLIIGSNGTYNWSGTSAEE